MVQGTDVIPYWEWKLIKLILKMSTGIDIGIIFKQKNYLLSFFGKSICTKLFVIKYVGFEKNHILYVINKCRTNNFFPCKNNHFILTIKIFTNI